MSITKHLSQAQQTALDHALKHGRLVRWPGGFWTYPDCEATEGEWVEGQAKAGRSPKWFVGVQTIMNLVDRGMLEISRSSKIGLVEVKPTGVLPS